MSKTNRRLDPLHPYPPTVILTDFSIHSNPSECSLLRQGYGAAGDGEIGFGAGRMSANAVNCSKFQ
jgi:hypothetical protein